MKLIKTYSQIVNEQSSYDNLHLLNEDQVDWIHQHVDI
jgi:hypothetical protein